MTKKKLNMFLYQIYQNRKEIKLEKWEKSENSVIENEFIWNKNLDLLYILFFL